MKDKKKNHEKDVFISYKNDGEGNNFAARLESALSAKGYNVYFNPNEQHAGSFPERLRNAVEKCNDFILVLTQKCLDSLIEHKKIDWVREELLIAYNSNKNIIPLLMPGVIMPADKDIMPDDLKFLPDKDAINMMEPYDRSPMDSLFDWIKSKPIKYDVHKDTYNSNENRNIMTDFKANIENTKNNDYKSMFELANMYYYGLVDTGEGCMQDFNKAYDLLRKIVESDTEYSLMAHSMIAELYYHGILPRQSQSYEKALKHHEIAKSISGFSSREYAYLKSRGCGCEFDYDSIVQSYSAAVEKGDSMAIVGLAKFYMSYGKYQEAADLYKRTSHVLPDAEFRLGMMYRNGQLEDPPKPDFFRAAFYFQHAISSGFCNADVYHELGRLYFTPTGDFPKDFKEAEKNFKIASDLGNKDAQYKLGLMYEYGYVTKDIEKAIYYHSLAASQGSSFSAYHLAMLYLKPQFKNYHEAFKYAELAAKKGVMEGEFLLGFFLLYGRGCNADENKAHVYFSHAYEHGMIAAKLFMDKISTQHIKDE